MDFKFINLNKYCHPATDPQNGLSTLYPSVKADETPAIVLSGLEPGFKFLSFEIGLKNNLKCLNHLSLVCQIATENDKREHTFAVEQSKTLFLPIPSKCQSVRIEVAPDGCSPINYCGVYIGKFLQTNTNKEFQYELYIAAKHREDGSFFIDSMNPIRGDVSPEMLPVPSTQYMEYGESATNHLKSGKETFEAMLKALQEAEINVSSFDRTLEFGCSNARILRWFLPYQNMLKWGVDIQAEKIKWCLENLSPYFHFATTTQVPHLSFPDGYFDFIYAGSVFTHINELHNQWIIELARISKAGGYLYLTFHDESTVQVLLNSESDKRSTAKELKSDSNLERIKKGEYSFISIAPKSRVMLSNVYMTREYIRYITEPFLDLVAVKERAYGQFQTAYIFRKK